MSPSESKRSRSHGHIGATIAAVVTITLALLLFFNRQWAIDQIAVWQYHPSAAVATLVNRSGMSSTGKFVFYASRPSIDSAQTFNAACGESGEDHTAILGCYSNHQIHIYNVTNPQLDGIRTVTAAHEMLHAAYSRMSGSDRQSVDKLVETEYRKLKSNKQFSERMQFYEKTEPGQRDNELHSILGTEVADLSPELEAHYKQYFSDRQKTVDLYQKYSAVFTTLQERGEKISKQLDSLGPQIDSETKQYNSDVAVLSQDIEAFNKRAKNGDFTSQAEFYDERAALVNRAHVLDARRSAINADITKYNELRDELAQIASQSQVLNRSIDSHLSTPPTL